MYNVSDSYKAAISANVRNGQAVKGQVTLVDGEMNIPLDNSNIVSGSLTYTAQIGDGFSVGGVTAAQLELGLITDLENPYSLYGARVTLSYGIVTAQDDSGDVWEWVPLGIFYVTDISRQAGYAKLTALDGFIKMDVKPRDIITSGSVEVVLRSILNAANITGDLSNLSTFPNYTSNIVVSETDKIETLRDCVMWICQLLGCFGRIKRDGIFELVHLHSDSVKTITPGERKGSTSVDDTYSEVNKLTMTVDSIDYVSGTSDPTLELEENPFMSGWSSEWVQAALDAILAEVTQAGYTPMTCTTFGDPALMPGDYVTLTNTAALDGDPTCLITDMSWTFRGDHTLTATGVENDAVSYSQSNKAVSALKRLAEAAKIMAQASNDSTELIKQTLGGNVLIRQQTGETNEILIMDSPDPEKAVKIWRWNMGGLGYSDNCTGADNAAREYKTAITMDGAVSADFVKTGLLMSLNGASWIDMSTGSFSFANQCLYYDSVNQSLTMGSPESNLQTVYTSGKISFRNSGTEVAYISGADNMLHIRFANVTESLRIGKFAWIPRRNGNLSLVKVSD